MCLKFHNANMYLTNILMSKIRNTLFAFGQRQAKNYQVKSVDFFIIFPIDIKIPLNISVLAESTLVKLYTVQNLKHTLGVESGLKDKHFMLIWCVYVFVALLSLLLNHPVFVL